MSRYHRAFRMIAIDESVVVPEYPTAGETVSGLRVINNIPDTDMESIDFEDYEILDEIREVTMSDFNPSKAAFHRPKELELSRALATEISESGWIAPLIVVFDADVEEKGPYILEGAHRFVALFELGVRTFPALIVLDKDTQTTRMYAGERGHNPIATRSIIGTKDR